MLTTGTDAGPAFTGTAGNDTFNADVGLLLNGTTGVLIQTDTLQSVDVLKGGAGIDTLNFTTAGAVANPLPTLESIEIINAKSLAGLTLDTSVTCPSVRSTIPCVKSRKIFRNQVPKCP
ncbi:MAG: hypothetical protein KIG95_05450 [Comamonas sp.]|nr:hypothetical protein [Comamonas sp.]